MASIRIHCTALGDRLEKIILLDTDKSIDGHHRNPVMEIPWQSLSQDALINLVQEYVSRDGTDYGETETPMETKVGQVLARIREGSARIHYDPGTGTTTVVDAGQGQNTS